MNITLCNGKGGTGKTTLAVMLAHALREGFGLFGKTVAVLDLDPQRTATAWLADLDGPVSLAEPGGDYDVVLIDTPPDVKSLAFAGGVHQADVVVVVSSPSPADVWTTRVTADVVKQHLRPHARARILFNQVQPHTVLARNLPTLARRIGIAPLGNARAPDVIRRRVCYQHAALLGWRALSKQARAELYGVALDILTTPDKGQR